MHSSTAPHFSATLRLAMFSISTTISSRARPSSLNRNAANKSFVLIENTNVEPRSRGYRLIAGLKPRAGIVLSKIAFPLGQPLAYGCGTLSNRVHELLYVHTLELSENKIF
jgi:hypothetical protein